MQNIKSTPNENGSVCLNVKFVKGSIASGCHVEIICDSVQPISFTISKYNVIYYQFRCSPSIGITNNETCRLEGFDEVDGVIENNDGPAVELSISVPGVPAVSISVGVSSSSVPSPSTTG